MVFVVLLLLVAFWVFLCLVDKVAWFIADVTGTGLAGRQMVASGIVILVVAGPFVVLAVVKAVETCRSIRACRAAGMSWRETWNRF